MSILDFSDAGLDEVHEEITVEAGEEYKLAIVSILSGKKDKNGRDYIMPFFEVVDSPYCKEFGDFIITPDPEWMSKKELNKARNQLGQFFAAFKMNPKFDSDEVQGNEGWAILGIDEGKDGQPQNKINKYMVGH